MADALLSLATDFLKQLGSITVQQAQQEINLIVGVDEEIEKLSNSFKIVRAMLNDAEERQWTEAAVKLWLDQLRDVYYMMGDVLDEWNTARIKSETQKEEERAVINDNPAALKKKKWYEDSNEDYSSIRTFTTARLVAAKAGGGSGSGSARNTKIKTENLSSYATVKIENLDGTKDGGAQGTGPAGPTAPAGSSFLKKKPRRSSLRTFRPVEIIAPEKKV